MDHHHHHGTADGPWTGGWLVALGAGLFAVLLVLGISEAGSGVAIMAGGLTFLVFGVLLGAGGVELTLDHHHGDGGGHH